MSPVTVLLAACRTVGLQRCNKPIYYICVCVFVLCVYVIWSGVAKYPYPQAYLIG